VADGRMDWRRILCETNVSPQLISRIQSALRMAGHDPGPIDGVLGQQTRRAVTEYQKKKGLASGELTYRTLESLGVKPGT
jgi:peptidoglycan hydrolase-like protein with peptidoglycan-binding domain